MLLKVAKVLKENEKLKFNQFIDLTAVDYPNKKIDLKWFIFSFCRI